jgi:hypothetical protein
VSSLRVLHAPRNIANQAGYVVGALRRLDVDAEVWEYDPSPFAYPADRNIPIDAKDPEVFWTTFLEAIDRFDVFHFHFARTLFPNTWGGVPALWDLPIYRILGKRVFFTFHGSDCRIREIHEQANPWSYFRFSDITADDDRTRKTIEVVRTYADRMFVTSVDLLNYVPEAEVTPRVIDLATWPERSAETREVPRILHVPSRRGTKGTEMILAGLERLRRDGVAFDLRLLEGVSHDAARAEIQDADIVVDNVLTGDYEVVSIEAMASSRVAVANIQAAAAEAYPDSPVVSVDPTTFEARMRDLIGDPDDRRRRGALGRPYVARIHDAPVIAAQLLAAYEATPVPVPVRSHPDWLSLAGSRTIESRDRRIAALEQDLARVRRREDGLRVRLGMEPLGGIEPRRTGEVLKAALPDPLRVALRRFRARVSRGRSGPRR